MIGNESDRYHSMMIPIITGTSKRMKGDPFQAGMIVLWGRLSR